MGLLKAEDIVGLTVPAFLAESPYSSFFTGIFLAQARVVGVLPIHQIISTPPTLDVGAPLMEAAFRMVSEQLSHLAIRGNLHLDPRLCEGEESGGIQDFDLRRGCIELAGRIYTKSTYRIQPEQP